MKIKKWSIILLLHSSLYALFLSTTPIYAQQIYNFQQVDSLPTFKECPTVAKTEVETWITCFYPKIETMIVDSIESMSRQLGMTFEGIIKVNFSIDSTGAIYEMEVRNKPHPILKKAAKDVLSSMEGLKPAKLTGEAVPISLTLEIEYYPEGKKALTDGVDNAIYKVPDIFPRFSGCEDIFATEKEKKICADKEMLKFIYKRIEYPVDARINGIEGTVVAGFVVEKDGSISNLELKRDIGRGCGEHFLTVLEMMNTEGIIWIPGKLDGKSVRVQYYLPIHFRLD